MGMAAARKQEVSLTAVLVEEKGAGSRGFNGGGSTQGVGRGMMRVGSSCAVEGAQATIDSPSAQPFSSLPTHCNKKYSSEESLVAVLSVYPQLHCSP
ncbi:Hypothetical protein SMAX5B_017469 [Scophthalmus maximus]|uniref:Uncharacterized protein n=1 Tax=Scophthalmus maximus TaxID=52904 RepID=A0A2U9CMY0_SCOMX|nr:Hypothetical protein SMAX5B_017469 [Scophthalmus maximus]